MSQLTTDRARSATQKKRIRFGFARAAFAAKEPLMRHLRKGDRGSRDLRFRQKQTPEFSDLATQIHPAAHPRSTG
jgi:hypothetical protein